MLQRIRNGWPFRSAPASPPVSPLDADAEADSGNALNFPYASTDALADAVPETHPLSHGFSRELIPLEKLRIDSLNQHFAFVPPSSKYLGDAVIVASNLFRIFHIPQRKQDAPGGKRACCGRGNTSDDHSDKLLAPAFTGDVIALRNISLNFSTEVYPIRKGEFVIIRGPSGGGKTTLLNLFGVLDTPSSGLLSVLGVEIHPKMSAADMAKLRLARIGFVFQTFNLMAALSAFENVELPMMLLNKLSSKERAERAGALLKAVGLADRFAHLPSELSGGEQQRVAIARALGNNPELLLLDEPTGDLDTRNTVEVMNLLLDINLKQGTTLVMVTHNPDLECYADRILYVEDGTFKRQVINTKQIALTLSSAN